MYINSKFNQLIKIVTLALLCHGYVLGNFKTNVPLLEAAVQDALLPGDLDRDGRFTSQPKFTFQPPRFMSIKPPRPLIPETPVAADPEAIQQALPNRSAFVENRGQWPAEVRYQVRLGGVKAWITDRGVV